MWTTEQHQELLFRHLSKTASLYLNVCALFFPTKFASIQLTFNLNMLIWLYRCPNLVPGLGLCHCSCPSKAPERLPDRAGHLGEASGAPLNLLATLPRTVAAGRWSSRNPGSNEGMVDGGGVAATRQSIEWWL